MRKNELIRKLLYYVSVPKCVHCNERLDYEDMGLCKRCEALYSEHKKRNCSRCSKVLSECTCSSDYLFAHGIKNVSKLFRYSKQEQAMPSNYLIYSLKQDNRNDVITRLSGELAESLSCSYDISKDKYIITCVPRRRRAIINFGFDHAEVLAKRVAELLGIEYKRLLVSKSKNPQKSVIGEARLSNVSFDYKSNAEISLKGYTVIIVDDVITTGASMSACATLIKAYRPKRIIGAALGIAYKDSNKRK